MKFQIPCLAGRQANSKFQINSDVRSSKRTLVSVIGTWSLFGIWSLIIGISAFPSARAQVDTSAFDPGLLIQDQNFADTGTFGSAAGIQKFLEVKGSVLANTAPEFLAKLKEPTDSSLKASLSDPRPNLERRRTAAELVYDASLAAGINPQVMIVTAQKEQGLVTNAFTSEQSLGRALDRAFGYACTEDQPCGDIFLGFYFQLFGNFDREGGRFIGAPKSLVRSFLFEVSGSRVGRGPAVNGEGIAGARPFARTARKGDTITVENTLNGFPNVQPQQQVTLKNFATAALYRYTPHVYNGNFNFWRFYQQWFRYPNGTLIQLLNTVDVYVIENGTKRKVSPTVMTLRKLNVSQAISVSQIEFADYVLEKPLPPPEGTLIRAETGGETFLIEQSRKRPISSFIIEQRKLDPAKTILLPEEEVTSYDTGERVLPEEGTLVKVEDSALVLIVEGGKIRPISAFVFQQRQLGKKKILVAKPGELELYPRTTPLPPLPNTLVRTQADPTVYLWDGNLKRPISFSVFVMRKFDFRKVATLSQEEIDGMAKGSFLTAPDGTLVMKEGEATVYIVEKETKRPLTAFVFQNRKFSFTNVVVLSAEEVDGMSVGVLLAPKDGTLVKGDKVGTVYLIDKGTRRGLTLEAFRKRSFSFSRVVELPQSEVDSYPTGESLLK